MCVVQLDGTSNWIIIAGLIVGVALGVSPARLQTMCEGGGLANVTIIERLQGTNHI